MNMGYRENQNFKSITIVDEFFEDVEKIREIALSCEYKTCEEHKIGGTWPGKRSDYLNNILDDDVFEQYIFKMFKEIHPEKKVKKYYIDSFFQICGKDDGDSWVHQDNYSWCNNVSVIYLSPNPEENSGTIIYKPIDCGFNAYDITNRNNYEEVETIDNVYNRLVSYDPLEYHKSDTYFGDTFQNSRLTIVSFFSLEFEDAEV